MSTLDIAFLSAAVSAFVIFAGVLAWGEYRTQHIGAKPQAASAAGFEALKNAAAKSEVKSRSPQGVQAA